MADFKVGDVVVCVDDSPCTSAIHENKVPCPYRRGDIARVVGICPDPARNGISLSDDKHAPHKYIVAYRFKHLPKADEQFTEEMRAIKERTREKVS